MLERFHEDEVVSKFARRNRQQVGNHREPLLQANVRAIKVLIEDAINGSTSYPVKSVIAERQLEFVGGLLETSVLGVGRICLRIDANYHDGALPVTTYEILVVNTAASFGETVLALEDCPPKIVRRQ
jgi:hypothetical protein